MDAVYAEPRPRAQERLNAATHAFGAFLGIVGLVFLVMHAETVGRPDSLAAVIVYGTAMVLLFLFSALHHAVLRPRIKHILLGLDHGGIYLLIAGPCTPFCLLMPRGEERTLLALVWGLVMPGIAIQVASFLTRRSGAYERFAYIFYLGLGWIPMLWAGEDAFRALAPMGLTLLVAGGVAFTIGVAFYLWKNLPCGHAVWHLFVAAGCAFHFLAIIHYVVPKTI